MDKRRRQSFYLGSLKNFYPQPYFYKRLICVSKEWINIIHSFVNIIQIFIIHNICGYVLKHFIFYISETPKTVFNADFILMKYATVAYFMRMFYNVPIKYPKMEVSDAQKENHGRIGSLERKS